MKKPSGILSVVVGLALLAALGMGLATVLQNASRGGTPGRAVATEFPKGYPPPQATPILIEPTPILQNTPVIIYANQSPTPISTFTPRSLSTREPGPTGTPLPLLVPAQNNAASILRYAVHGNGNNPGAVKAVKISEGEKWQTEAQPAQMANLPRDRIYYPSPDGKYIAVIQGVEAGDVVSILDVASGKQEPLFKEGLSGMGSFFGWYPDSRHVLYYADSVYSAEPHGSEFHGGLWLVDINLKKIAIIADQQFGRIYGATASPDGSKIVYSHTYLTNDLWLINADGSDAHIILSEETAMGGLAWSPDGSKIAYTAGGELKITSADGSNPHMLSKNYADDYLFAPVWSPDSHLLAYIAYDGAPPAKGTNLDWDTASFTGTNIHIVDTTTGEDWPLMSGSTGNIDPAWSPDGKQIAFASMRNGISEIWIADVKGANLHQVTNDQQVVRHPMWQRLFVP